RGGRGGTRSGEVAQAGPGATYAVVGTPGAGGGRGTAAAAPARRRALPLLSPEPVVTADVVLAAVASSTKRDDAEGLPGNSDLAAALARDGWRGPRQPAARRVRGTPAPPPTSGLPSDPRA